MALVLKDRVRETTTTAGTGTVTLAGAVTGFQSFAIIGNGNTTYYCISGQGTNEWEVGIGTYTSSGTTLARTTVLANSSATQPSALSFSAGTKDVFVTYPAEKSVNLDASDNVSALGTVASGTWQGTTVAVGYGGTGLTSGTSGGVLYYSASGTLASSAALAANALVVGGGAGAAPSTVTTGTGVVTALGVNTGSAGAFVVNGGALGTPSSGTLTNCTFPTLNQDTTGSAVYWKTSGTGKAAISGPGTGTTRTFTFPDADATVLTTNAAVTVGQGGTGQTSYTDGQLLIGNTSGNTLTKSTLTAGSNITITNGNGSITIASTSAGVTASNDTTTSSNLYPAFLAATTGTVTTAYTSNAKLLYKPSTGEFQASELVASNGFIVNKTEVAANYTIASGYNALSVGPVTVDSGITVTVTSGQRWVVI